MSDEDLANTVREVLTAESDTGLWQRLTDLGFSTVAVPESAGGAGGGWAEAAALLGASAGTARHVPFAETSLLAHWLLRSIDAAGQDPSRPRTIAVTDDHGCARAVPWLTSEQDPEIASVVVLRRCHGGAQVAELSPAELAARARITPVSTPAGLPRAHLELTGELPDAIEVPAFGDLLDRLLLRGALARAVQIAAALDTAVELCVQHARERVQFGRPLAKFQAVQHLVADAAAEAALARAAVDAAVLDAVDTDLTGPSSATKVAVARSCVGHATSVVVRNAHQVHGAMGTTREHPLHLFTQPVLEWRGEFGTTRDWDRFLGETVRATPAALWDVVIGTATEDPAVELPDAL